MQMETNVTTVATLAIWQCLSAEVKQIQMSPGLYLALCSFISVRHIWNILMLLIYTLMDQASKMLLYILQS